ncbi:MAG: anaerobic ribonucleoside-triphosphate reductase [Candidatus Bathyarchaeales archaeon]
MSHTRKGVKILKAVSSGIRLQVLTLLYDKGPLSYTEIMNNLKLNQTKDAGRFAYHLKFLLKTDLIEPDVETKKYKLTDLGKMIVDISEEIEKHTFKRRKILVRTSRLAMEEFDRNKIALSLIKEANVPVNLAQNIARETEKRLQEFKTKYLTAPLIREIVNAILLEKGLEEYRHKLTRLGVPVYDVTQLIKNTAKTHTPSVEAVHKAAGDAVIEEYTLLNVLPRDISDAYMSGAIHIENLGMWILKPNEIAHDLRYFLKNSLGKPLKNLDQALATTLNMLQNTSREINGEQTIDYFNIFLAPFTKNVTTTETEEKLRLFLQNLNQTQTSHSTPVQVTLGIELNIPDFLKEKTVQGPEEKSNGYYAEFEEETQKLAYILLKVILDENKQKPSFNPSIMIKLRPENLNKTETQPILILAHQLATLIGTPYFANYIPEKQTCATYAATGTRIGNEWKEDWEIDTMRTGNLDTIAINLPRIAYQNEKEEAKFFQQLEEQLETAAHALEIKHQTIKQRLEEKLLPFLSQPRKNENYYHHENATRTISFTGLNEATKALLGKPIHTDKEALQLAEKIAETIAQRAKEFSRKPEIRVVTSMLSSPEAATRFAQLDAERFGWAKINAQGSKENPAYTNVGIIPLNLEIPWQERLSTEEPFHKLTGGGHITLLSLQKNTQNPEELLSNTKQIVNTFNIGLFAYDQTLNYCTHCGKLTYRALPKCPLCGTVDSLKTFTRASTKYQQHNPQT